MKIGELIKILSKLPKDAEIEYAHDSGRALCIEDVKKSRQVMSDYYLIGMVNHKVEKMIYE